MIETGAGWAQASRNSVWRVKIISWPSTQLVQFDCEPCLKQTTSNFWEQENNLWIPPGTEVPFLKSAAAFSNSVQEANRLLCSLQLLYISKPFWCFAMDKLDQFTQSRSSWRSVKLDNDIVCPVNFKTKPQERCKCNVNMCLNSSDSFRRDFSYLRFKVQLRG